MNALQLVEALSGGLLLFFVPGFAISRALFPEWRLTGPGGLRRGLETATLSFVLSVGLTVLVGYGLLSAAPGGFSASWSDPVLESCLAGVAAIAFAAGLFQGAYSHRRTGALSVPPEPGGEGAWALTRELDRLGREERRLARQLSMSRGDPEAAGSVERRLAELRDEARAIEARREAEYDL
jgi:Protein of unknown function (DUF1616)